jgi:glycosyltransferase involved in cell wall biosynthesis
MTQAGELQHHSRHVAFLLPNLGLGGAERVTLDLARGFAARGVKVDLVLMERAGEFLEQVPDGVTVVDLGARRLRSAILPLRRYLKEHRPDALVAAMWPLTTVSVLAVSGLKTRPRLVLTDHAPLLAQYADSWSATLKLKSSIRATYRLADRIVAVCDGLGDELARLSGLARGKVTTIYNPIPQPECSASAKSPWPRRPTKRIVSAGRLKPVKNYPLLVEAFAPLAHRGDGAVLAILGEGSDRAAIEAAAERLGVADRVLLPGYTPLMGDWLRGADLLVSASNYEGFGNVLIEALHFGLTVVSTDCPYGPREVLGDGRWGSLVPTGDATALTAALQSALERPLDQHAQMARADEFNLERAVDAYWHALFT